MFPTITRLAALALVAWLALPLAAAPASAASADKLTTASPLLSLKMLDAKQTKLLQRAGIRTIRALAIGKTQAIRIVKDAKVRISQFQKVYYAAQRKYQILVQLSAAPSSEADQYASLIEPTNECTILVRKVCGLENQCATSPGCPIAMLLLERYNEESDAAETAESCVIALEDGIIFNQCID